MTDHPEELDLSEVRRDLKAYTDGPMQTGVEPDTSLRCRLLMAVPLLLDRVDRLRRERDILRLQLAMVENSSFLDQLAQAITDPGSVLSRRNRDSDRPESVNRWSVRAVVKVVQGRWRHDVR